MRVLLPRRCLPRDHLGIVSNLIKIFSFMIVALASHVISRSISAWFYSVHVRIFFEFEHFTGHINERAVSRYSAYFFTEHLISEINVNHRPI